MINARHIVVPETPWIPEGSGKWSRPLRFLSHGRGWVELMRLDPGVRLGVHRHSGEVHAFSLQGQRRLCTGEIIQPGDYVHESAGNTDWWESIGHEPLILFVAVNGSVEYLDLEGTVRKRITTADRIADYERYCREQGIVMLDLREPELAPTGTR